MIKVKRKTKRELIENRYSGGSWYENVTTIYFSFLGLNVKTIHKYFISYRGKLCTTAGDQYYKSLAKELLNDA